MHAPEYCRPIADDTPGRYRFTVPDAAAVGPPGAQFMMGGVGLGAAIAALEAHSGRPLVNAACQFVSVARPGERLAIEIIEAQAGRNMTQARAIARVDGREVIAVQAALGVRDAQPDAQFVAMPEVTAPMASVEIPAAFPELQDLHSHLLKRDAGVDEATGRACHWMGPVPGGVPNAPLLAVVADVLAGGHERTRGASSLDNVLRIARLVPTDWVLCEIRIEAIAAGSFHGVMRLFAEDGTLLATASQSGAVPKTGAGWAHAHVSPEAKRLRGN